jgi:hypothetical protein
LGSVTTWMLCLLCTQVRGNSVWDSISPGSTAIGM